MAHERKSSVTEALVLIWQSVLERSPILEGDNFFNIGGDPSRAVRLFDEIAKVFGQELPTPVIYHAPTITDLASIMQKPVLPKFSPLVPLRAGEAEPPVFLAHGLGGSVMEFFSLAEKLQTSHPIYGLQAIGPDGGDVSFHTVEDAAKFYVEAIRERQPRGPYHLIGFSFGGLVVLEIAQRLSSAGETIGLLAMLDAYPFQKFLTPMQRVELVLRLLRYHASNLKRLPIRRAVSYVLRSAERTAYSTRKGVRNFVRVPFSGSTLQALESANLALTRYQPRPYSGKVVFVAAEAKSVFPANPAAVWKRWMKSFGAETMPGDHYGMLSENSDSLASILSRVLYAARLGKCKS
jgi:acetoacetyl-CoA synthetase